VLYSGQMNKTSSKAALAAAILTATFALTGCAASIDTHATGDMSHETTKLTEAAGFAEMMIPHHLQAITMAAYAKENAEDPQVLALAQQIYTAQAAEIETMKSWLGATEIPEGMMSDGMLTEAQMTALAEAKGAEFDKLFLEGMTAHHHGAIAMATTMQQTEDAELKKLITAILQTQTIEISMMKLMNK
jgi:uncharacterized protein (DUF305 family)